MFIDPAKATMVKECLEILTEEEREAFLMKYYHGYNLLEISINLGYSKSWKNSWNILQRAHSKIDSLFS